MKQEQLLMLCQRHHAVLLGNAADELNIAVVGTPPGELMDSLRFASQKRIDIECWTQERMDKYLQQSAPLANVTPHEESDNAVDLLNHLLKQALISTLSRPSMPYACGCGSTAYCILLPLSRSR